MDIKAAFLQGKPIKRNFYLKSPKEAETEKTWKLNTAAYVLYDITTARCLSVKQELIKTGGTKSKYDGAIFDRHNGSKLERILSSYVNNFFWTGTSWFYVHVIDYLQKKYVISKEEKNGIEIHQKGYIEEVVRRTIYYYPIKLSR